MDNEEFFREDFPVVGAKELGGTHTNGAFAEHMDEFQRRMHEILDRESLPEAFVHFCMKTNPMRRAFQLPHTWSVIEEMDLNTCFMVPASQKVLVDYDDHTEHAVIKLLGHVLNLNKVPKGVVAALFSDVGKPFSGREILERNKGVEWAQLRPTLVTLYENGVLVLPDNE